jgi:hypothetical protein
LSGAHRLAAGELTLDGNKNLKGEAYLKAVDEEMNKEPLEGSEEDLAEDKKEGTV